MRGRDLIAAVMLGLVVWPAALVFGQEPAARALLNSWEVHGEVKRAAGTDAAVARELISFRDYMDFVLFHPSVGYYSSGRVRLGPDFQTYPMALAPQFGQMAAEQMFRMWQGMRKAGTLGANERFTVAEFGAGDGVFAESILDYLESQAKRQGGDAEWREFAAQALYVCYDRSPALSKAQRTRNARFGKRFEAREADATDPAATIQPDSLKGVVLSNELPDAFSVHKVILGPDGGAEVAFVAASLSLRNWARVEKLVAATVAREVSQGDVTIRKLLQSARPERVYLSGAAFVGLLKALQTSSEYEATAEAMEFQEVYLPVAAVPELAGHLQRYAGAYARELARLDAGVVTYVNLGAEQYIRGAGRILKAGYVVTLDYGTNWEGMLGQTGTGHLRTFGPAHREVNSSAGFEGDDGQVIAELDTSDPYRGPTLNDLTTDVNFSLLAAEGDVAALRTLYYGPQSALRTGTPVQLPSSNTWSQTFETNGHYKLMVQQKHGTDAAYAYPQNTQEPLATSESHLSDSQRRRAQEIQKRLQAAQR